MVVLVDFVKQKEENAGACRMLSKIVREEINGTGLKVSEPYPNELPLFYFYKNLIGKILIGMDYEPLFIDGGPPYPHIRVRDNSYLGLARRIAGRYEKETGRQITIEYASAKNMQNA
jgi:hypothetical protein